MCKHPRREALHWEQLAVPAGMNVMALVPSVLPTTCPGKICASPHNAAHGDITRFTVI